jgi:hypothetical protein
VVIHDPPPPATTVVVHDQPPPVIVVNSQPPPPPAIVVNNQPPPPPPVIVVNNQPAPPPPPVIVVNNQPAPPPPPAIVVNNQPPPPPPPAIVVNSQPPPAPPGFWHRPHIGGWTSGASATVHASYNKEIDEVVEVDDESSTCVAGQKTVQLDHKVKNGWQWVRDTRSGQSSWSMCTSHSHKVTKTVHRSVTVAWNASLGCYGYYDSHNVFQRVG